LAQLDAGRDDALTTAIRKVYDLTGRWYRGRQLYTLQQYQGPREKPLRVTDVIEMFVAKRDQK
jgi:hypothetical protein